MLENIIVDHFWEMIDTKQPEKHVQCIYRLLIFFIRRQGQNSLFAYNLTPLPYQTYERAKKPNKTRFWAK